MRRILLLDDEIYVLNALVRAMRQHLPIDDLRIETFTNPFDALKRCCECNFDIAISDYRMPQMNGAEFLHALEDIAPTTVRICLSASTEFETVASAVNDAHVWRYIPKPWQADELARCIAEALLFRDLGVEELRLADQQRQLDAQPTPQELEAQWLESEEPGLLKVKWGPNGEILL
ncbi:MAG: response regulator [Pseudomonadota bacterium]